MLAWAYEILHENFNKKKCYDFSKLKKKLLFLEQTQINGVVLWALMFSTVQNECWVFWVNGPEVKQIKETNNMPNSYKYENIRESGVQQKLRHQRIALPPEMVYKQRNENFHYE